MGVTGKYVGPPGVQIIIDTTPGYGHFDRSIPYAEPPVGKLRFAKPQPIITPIKMRLNLKIHAFNPMHIWTANVETNNPSKDVKLKPVMFYIHGGGLSGGSVFSQDISVLATNGVVFASTSYRLGQLGFLYGDREDAPGNVGFHDQLLALKW
ncbi:unnamed protein product, partial [Oppiella nova]